MSAGFVVWFTGLSGAGKSTLAAMLSAELRRRGVHVELLDGDEVRTHLSKGLGFSKEDRDTNIRRIGFVAKLLSRAGACAMTAAISPYRAIRDEQRAQIGRFVEVYCACAVPALAERDPKGLYKKALAGEIKHFTGVDDPYEEPTNPEVIVYTDKESKEESLSKIVHALEALGYIPAREGLFVSRSKGGLVQPHGGELTRRLVEGEACAALVARAKDLSVVDIDERAARDVEMFATGAYSPLKGFMNSKDYLRVVREMRLENGLPWPLPITLAVTREVAAGLAVGKEVSLRAPDGRLVAVLEVTETFTPDKALEAMSVYGTTDPAHPGVAALMHAGAVYVGGEVAAVSPALAALAPPEPRATRAALSERGHRRVVGYAARGPVDRAAEYLTKAALEGADGLLIQLLTGSAGSVPDEIAWRTWEAVASRYYASERVLLAAATDTARHGGAREALLCALMLKNHGASHVLLRAGDGIEALFEHFAPGELGMEPLFYEDAFLSATLGGMATSKTAPERARGEGVKEATLRPEAAEILRGAKLV